MQDMAQVFVQPGSTWPAYALLAIFLHLAVVRSLRYRREHAMRRRYKYPDRESMAKMTNDEAQAILQYILEYEFPYMYRLSLEFALFKTYCFKSVSSLLLVTKELSTKANSGKRVEDTALLVGEFSSHPPTCERSLKAISRMNYLHNQYISKGLIKNEDMLYTLSVFITEPVRFMRLYEWRSMNEMEVCALGTFWKSIGDAMEINYSELERYGTWRDGIDFYEDVLEWSRKRAISDMVPAKSNETVAEATMPILLWPVPGFLIPTAREVLYTIMGDRVREAFSYPEPSVFSSLVAFIAIQCRKLVLRHLFLPRITPCRCASEEDAKTGRIYSEHYFRDPYYIKPTFWRRWGPAALATRLAGGLVPDANASKYHPEGFLTQEIGPRNKVGKGLEEIKSNVEKLKKERPAGCPFF